MDTGGFFWFLLFIFTFGLLLFVFLLLFACLLLRPVCFHTIQRDLLEHRFVGEAGSKQEQIDASKGEVSGGWISLHDAPKCVIKISWQVSKPDRVTSLIFRGIVAAERRRGDGCVG